MPRLLAAAVMCTLAVGGLNCSKKNDEAVAPAASALALPSADLGPTAWHYRIVDGSTTHVDLPGLQERIKGGTTAASGTLDIVPTDLAKSVGLVRVDLASFSTRTFGDAEKDATQTKHARTWLEVVADGKTNESMRWAEFAIRSIDGLSATDPRLVAPTKDGSDDVRTVTMTVKGDLLIHGHRVAKEDVVDVAFRYPAGAVSTSKPTRIDIRSKQPMRVVLKEHDVSPRDPAGQLLAWTSSLVSKVAETADVTVELSATPVSP